MSGVREGGTYADAARGADDNVGRHLENVFFESLEVVCYVVMLS